MMQCPIAYWSTQSPHNIALETREKSYTYQELDLLINKQEINENPLSFKARPELACILNMYAAWRQNSGIFPQNPKAPTTSTIEFSRENIATYLQTSSSTPKIACHTFENHLASARSAIIALDLTPDDAYLLNLPLHHVSGIAICMRTFLAGATLLFPEVSSHPTHISMVPTQLFRLIKNKEPLPNIQCILIGGASLSNKLYEEALEKNLPIYMSYGMTETSSMISLKKPDGLPLSAGNPLPHVDVKISSNGEIHLRGPSIFQGYLGGKPHETNDWFATKDIGRFNEHQQLEIIGRKDRQFISGGENIHPEEIEKLLLELPQIIQVRVDPINDEEFGQRPAAILSCEKSISLDEIQKHLESRLPRYKIPKTYEFKDQITGLKPSLE